MKKVLNSRFYYDKLQYFVKWLKYSDTDNEWLKSSEFDEIQKLIRDFHEKYFDKPAKGEPNRKRIKTWFYWAFLVRSRHTYITLIIIKARTRDQIESERMKFNLNKKKKTKTQSKFSHYLHSLRYHWKTSKKHYLLASFHQNSHLACACDLKSQSSWSYWSFFEKSSMSFLFSSFFLSPRSLSLRQSLSSSRQRNSKSHRDQIDDRSYLLHLFRRRDKISRAVFVSKVETTMFRRTYSTSKSVASFLVRVTG